MTHTHIYVYIYIYIYINELCKILFCIYCNPILDNNQQKSDLYILHKVYTSFLNCFDKIENSYKIKKI